MSDTYSIKSLNEAETINIGKIIGELAKPGAVIALIGDLGAGKTVLAKGIAGGLGVEQEPNSPTFVILNVYNGRLTLNHFDLYRIQSEDELIDIGFSELINSEGVSVIEWADKISDILPEDTLTIEIYHSDGENNNFSNKRNLIIKGQEEWVSLFKNMVEQA